MNRRLRLLEGLAGEHELDVTVVYGANRAGGAVPWLTGWPVTREAVVIVRPTREPVLLVGHPNHVPNARRVARGFDVRPCGESTAETVAAVAGTSSRAGVIGGPPERVREVLARTAALVGLDDAYLALRLRKSPEELATLRHAAALTDRSAAALTSAAVPGASELDLVAAVEASYAGTGATNHLHYVSTTSMRDPDRSVPGQLPTNRTVQRGSAVVFELSTAWGPDYAGQLLRTLVVDSEPTPLFRDLHDVATEVHDAVVARLRPGALPTDLLAAAQPVLDAGFGTVDDLVHGFGGGYLPPVLSHRRRPSGRHAAPLEEGMTLVVQPNVVTRDLRAGVQTGELYEITEDGARSLHGFPAGMLTAGAA
jgi:Xaa-Pro aminopeptidase